jgi:hypothetical protein
MKTLASAAFLLLLVGCSSTPTDQSQSWTASDAAFQQQRRDADARAREVGDTRPYPEGWVGLPRNRSPEIIESIQLGQTMTEVGKVIGRQGWSRTLSRREFLDELRTTYGRYRSSRRTPQDLGGVEEHLPAHGRFVHWQYQGFSSTADWIVVFFAPPQDAPESEPRVVARGIFGLGCF